MGAALAWHLSCADSSGSASSMHVAGFRFLGCFLTASFSALRELLCFASQFIFRACLFFLHAFLEAHGIAYKPYPLILENTHTHARWHARTRTQTDTHTHGHTRLRICMALDGFVPGRPKKTLLTPHKAPVSALFFLRGLFAHSTREVRAKNKKTRVLV